MGGESCPVLRLRWMHKLAMSLKGNRTISDLRYGLKNGISPSALIFAAIKS